MILPDVVGRIGVAAPRQGRETAKGLKFGKWLSVRATKNATLCRVFCAYIVTTEEIFIKKETAYQMQPLVPIPEYQEIIS